MAREATHQSEHTGNAGLDRVQNNVRELIAYVKILAARVLRLETTWGNGAKRVTLSNASYTIETSDTWYAWYCFDGTLTAGRTITWPLQSTDATTHIRWVTNATTGGFALTIRSPHGTTTVNASTTRAIVFASTGPAPLT